jgi:hypothetical protein
LAYFSRSLCSRCSWFPELALVQGGDGGAGGDLAMGVRAQGIEFVHEAHLRRVLVHHLVEHGVERAAEGALEVGPLDDGDHRVRGAHLRRAVGDERLGLAGVEAGVERVFPLLLGLARLHLLEEELRRGKAGLAGAALADALGDAHRHLGARGEQLGDLGGPLAALARREG